MSSNWKVKNNDLRVDAKNKMIRRRPECNLCDNDLNYCLSIDCNTQKWKWLENLLFSDKINQKSFCKKPIRCFDHKKYGKKLIGIHWKSAMKKKIILPINYLCDNNLNFGLSVYCNTQNCKW
jgi:hypothetical protein